LALRKPPDASEDAIAHVLARAKVRTPDIGGNASTEELGTTISMPYDRLF